MRGLQPQLQDRGAKTMTETRDELLLERGLAPSRYVLDINRHLTVPHEMVLPPPWNLPSRLFRFPIEIGDAKKDGTRSIGLMHPMLRDHPFVQRVAAELGTELDPNGVPNSYGVSGQKVGLWWHAVDLVLAGKWRELIETRRFTTEEDIAGAVTFGLCHSLENACILSVAEARELMRAIGASEPEDRVGLLLSMNPPKACREEKGTAYWPLNSSPETDIVSQAWSRVLGIESGWFAYDRSGFLQWSQNGRDRYAAAGASTFIESVSGQAAFAF
jgi:hypothetical protein